MATIDDLPDDLLKVILEYACRDIACYPAVLLTCRRWRAFHTLVKGPTDLNCLLKSAATIESLSLMTMYKKWGAKNFDAALNCAASNGRLEAIILLKKWGAIYYFVLSHAAANNQLDAMRLLRDLGAMDFNWALASAASNGHLDAMRLAKEWGAKDFYLALGDAAGKGQLNAMRLLKEWGEQAKPDMSPINRAMKYRKAIECAVRNDQRSAAVLIGSWIMDA